MVDILDIAHHRLHRPYPDGAHDRRPDALEDDGLYGDDLGEGIQSLRLFFKPTSPPEGNSVEASKPAMRLCPRTA